jgi:hypothetical protein
MHTVLKAVLAAAAVVASMAASAQPFDRHDRVDTRDIDARQSRQQERIERGVQRGELTWREARTLREGQREIARVEADARSDGFLSHREARRLNAMLDNADTRIRELRHNAEHRRG